MATWDNNETDDMKVASKSKTGNFSEEESTDRDGGYDSDRCGPSGHRNWKDLKSKQAGGRTGRILLEDNLSYDEVGEDDKIDKERERECARRARRIIKMMNARMKLRPQINGRPQRRAALKAL